MGSSESESDWTFFFLIALSSEGVEDTDDPTPERKLVLFSSCDHISCAEWREDQQLLTLRGICRHRIYRPHPQDD